MIHSSTTSLHLAVAELGVAQLLLNSLHALLELVHARVREAVAGGAVEAMPSYRTFISMCA
jgi:hypothetical protein